MMKATKVLLTVGLIAWANACGNSGTPASADPQELALLRVEPADGAGDVPRNRLVRLVFNEPVLPQSVHDQSIRVRIGQTRPEGLMLISGNVVEFDPTVTEQGGKHAIGFPAGAQVHVEVPLQVPGSPEPANNFLQNVEGNPIAVASGTNEFAYKTGVGWDDPVAGAPGVLGLQFTPGPNSLGQVPATAAVTVVFTEPIDPATVVLNENVFVTNNTVTSPRFQDPVLAITFFDGSLTRYTFAPVFGYGKGPFNMMVGFIRPGSPDAFDPERLPRDLGGNLVRNFTFVETFDTQFDPNQPNVGVLSEEFQTKAFEDANETDAAWADDPQFPFTLVSAPISTRTVRIDANYLESLGAEKDLRGNCPSPNVLVGPDVQPPLGLPPTSAGRRMQSLYRAVELGGSGTVIGARWRTLGTIGAAGANYSRVVIRLGHKTSDANLTNVGFAAEYDVDGFVTVADTPYSVTAQSGGNVYIPWPVFETFFDYDGVHDLLMEVRATEGTATQALAMFIAASGSTCGGGPFPKTASSCAEFYSAVPGCYLNNSIGVRRKQGNFSSDDPIPAGTVRNLPNPAPAVYLAEFDLAQTRSVATSLYYDTGATDPDYVSPIVVPLVQSSGAQVELMWSGSHDGIVEDVPFTANINDVDGHRFIRWRANLKANYITGGRARIDRIEIPFAYD